MKAIKAIMGMIDSTSQMTQKRRNQLAFRLYVINYQYFFTS